MFEHRAGLPVGGGVCGGMALAPAHKIMGLVTFPWVFHRGSGGQSPPSFSIANAISAAGE